MNSRTRTLRSLVVYAAGFLPFALFRHSIGFVPSIAVGLVATLVCTLMFRWRDTKIRTLHQSAERGT